MAANGMDGRTDGWTPLQLMLADLTYELARGMLSPSTQNSLHLKSNSRNERGEINLNPTLDVFVTDWFSPPPHHPLRRFTEKIMLDSDGGKTYFKKFLPYYFFMLLSLVFPFFESLFRREERKRTNICSVGREKVSFRRDFYSVISLAVHGFIFPSPKRMKESWSMKDGTFL